MQQDKDYKNKTLAIIFQILSIVCMAIIFYFSSRNSDESSLQSEFIFRLLKKILGDNAITIFIVRKAAHFLEYLGTCLILNFALLFGKGKRKSNIPIAIATASAYAITDEIHQIFVDGRSCQIKDWALDTSGAITGAIVFLILFFVIDTVSEKITKQKSNIQGG